MIRLQLIIVNLFQFTNMAAPRGLVKTVIPVSLKPKRIRTLEYAFSLYTKTTCQKSAKSMRYRVSPKFEFYRKSLLTISKKQLMSLPLNLIFFRCIPIIIITDKTACYSVFYPSYIYAISHTCPSHGKII